MLNSLLDIIPKEDGNFYFSNFGEALVYALIGFLVVVLGIVLIIFIIWLIGFILRKTNNLAFLRRISIKKRKDKPVPESSAAQQNGSDDLPDGVKAAIIAAIVAYYGTEKPECEFKVKRIKRI